MFRISQALVSQMVLLLLCPGSQAAKCLLVSDGKSWAVTVEKHEDLANQPSFNCNLILKARSKSITFAHASLSPQLNPKVLGVLGRLPFSGLSENMRET